MIDKIKIQGQDIPIGGDIFDGDYVKKETIVLNNVILEASATTTYNMNSYLPDNDYDYLVLVRSALRTGAKKNYYANYSITIGSSTTGWLISGIQNRSDNVYIARGDMWIVVPKGSNRTFKLIKNGNSASADNYLVLGGYRRIGTNE